MKDIDLPTKFQIPWGNLAGPSFIRPIPQASQIGVQAGAASLTDGFPPSNFIPVSAGGTPPFGSDANGILFEITAYLRWVQAGGPTLYDGTFAAAIGGYPKGAALFITSGGVDFWVQSTIDDNTNDPTTAPATGWVPLMAAKPARIVATSTNITLLPTDYRIGLRRVAGVAAFDIQMISIPVGNSVRISDLAGNLFSAPVRMIPPAGHDIAGLANYTMNIDAWSYEFAYFGSLHWDVEQ